MSRRNSSHTTKYGRVVYKRRKHYFNLRDATRILERLDKVTGEYDFMRLFDFYIADVQLVVKLFPDLFKLAQEDLTMNQIPVVLQTIWTLEYSIAQLLGSYAADQWNEFITSR